MRQADTPLAALDRAIELARTESWLRLFFYALPGLCLGWLSALVYYLEWVEGVRALRPLFALAFALVYCARCALLSRLAGQFVDRLLVPAGGVARHASPLLALRAAALGGVELWLWLWLLVLAARVDVLLLPATLPLLALRGALLPSWLAACDGAPEPRLGSALREALRSANGRRGTGVFAELFLLVSALLLALNLGALCAALISVSQDVLGLELAFARAFISPRNHFALLLLAALSLSALEPLRAALSAAHYAEYRLAEEAIAVRTLIARVVAQSRAVSPAPLALALSLALAAHAHAQPAESWSPVHALSPGEECDESCREARARDDALLVELVSILDRPEFRDFPDRRWAAGDGAALSPRRWFERFLEWLSPGGAAADERVREPAAHRGVLRADRLALGASVVVLALIATLALRGRRRHKPGRPSLARAATAAPSASAKAAEDPRAVDARGELCALYLASLRGLAQRGLLSLADHATNGTYLRALRVAPEHVLLAELTRLFERARYGAIVPSPDELSRARALSAQLRGEAAP